jgi:outer membrane protein OmpA-like peptidoglycan-associated protein/tetratricopeptide (TPR) repeat protein
MHIKFYFAATALLIFSANSFAQVSFTKQGDALMQRAMFDKAVEKYQKAVKNDAKDVVSKEKLAQAYMMIGDYAAAEILYKELAANDASGKLNKLYYAQVLCNNGKYDSAAVAFKAYADSEPDDNRVKLFRNFSEDIVQLTQNIKAFELTDLPENSPSSDLGAAFCNGKVIITSNRDAGKGVSRIDNWTKKAFYDLYELRSDNQGNVAEPLKLKGKVNGKFNEGPACFSKDGSIMVFTKSSNKKGNDGIRKLGLYTATWDAPSGKWINIKPVPFNSNQYNVAHPALSRDGNRLYFASDMPGGKGETDLYMSVKNGDTWDSPVNLGKDINTTGREMFPYIADDGTLFFATDARPGLGGLDIFSSVSLNGKWTNIQNAGAPINSRYDDFSMVIADDGRSGFITSNRPGGKGDDDVWKFVKKSERICGTIVNASSKEGEPDVKVVATNGAGQQVFVRSNAKGDFCVDLTPNEQFKIEALKADFKTANTNFTPKAGKNERIILQIESSGLIELLVDVNQKDDGMIEGAMVELVDRKTGERYTQISPADGKVKFNVAPESEYVLHVVKKLNSPDEAYDRFTKVISTLGFTPAQPITEKAELTYYPNKLSFALPNVYFELNSFTLKPTSEIELEKVAKVMAAFPEMQVELSAHTDSRGSDQYNLTLSGKRAQTCVDYLVTKGVDKTRLIAIGYGELKLKNKCKNGVNCSEDEHAVNRRTEFQVVKIQ